MNVLITGALGFGGRNLNKFLCEEGSFKVFASDIHHDKSVLNYWQCDLLEYESVNALLLKTKPSSNET